MIKKFDSYINENINTSPIDLNKLKAYADAIGVICNGEYGYVHYKLPNTVFVTIGDANPFGDEEDLIEFMRSAIAVNYKVEDDIKILVDREAGPYDDEDDAESSNWISI